MNMIKWLNSDVGIGIILYPIIALAVWLILWKPLISRLLEKCNVCSFGYELLQMGALQSYFVVLGIVLFLLVMVSLMITSVQLVIANTAGVKGTLALLLFWGIVGTAIVAIIRSIRK